MKSQLNPISDPLSLAVEPVRDTIPARLQRYSWLALICVGPLLLLLLELVPSLDRPLLHTPLGHVLLAGGASLLGVILALLVVRVACRAQDGRVFLVGMGFLSIASIMIVHAIATPDVLMTGRDLATGWSALLSLVLGSFFFVFSGIDIPPPTNRWLMRHARRWLTLYLAFWIGYSWAFLIWIPALGAVTPASLSSPPAVAGPTSSAPTNADRLTRAPPADYAEYPDAMYGSAHAPPPGHPLATPAPQQPAANSLLDRLRLALTILGLGCYGFAAGRHYYLYHRSPSRAGLVITCGIVLFGEALLTQRFSQVYLASFWLYHAEEFIGFAVISYAVLAAYRHGQEGLGLLESLFLAGTRARLQADYTQAMEALVETLSRGEQPTPALVQALRSRFNLTESQVRVLEQAALAVAQERRQRQELERLNAALQQLERDRDQLMQMVVHDLKNPLTALVGFLEIMRLDQLTNEQRLLLDSALRSGKNLAGLISDLLDVGRFEEGRMELTRSSFAPRELLADCAAEMSAWMVQDGKTVRIEASDDLPLLSADLRIMRRVLLNLISNAIKHTPPGTQIVLRAGTAAAPGSGAGQAIVLEVEDTGPGIPPEYLERIFDKFSRVGGEHHPRQDSSGLGLTFCRLAVEAHGGTIGVTSTVGQGTTFRITLPLV